jgi:hypothetical protein
LTVQRKARAADQIERTQAHFCIHCLKPMNRADYFAGDFAGVRRVVRAARRERAGDWKRRRSRCCLKVQHAIEAIVTDLRRVG